MEQHWHGSNGGRKRLVKIARVLHVSMFTRSTRIVGAYHRLMQQTGQSETNGEKH